MRSRAAKGRQVRRRASRRLLRVRGEDSGARRRVPLGVGEGVGRILVGVELGDVGSRARALEETRSERKRVVRGPPWRRERRQDLVRVYRRASESWEGWRKSVGVENWKTLDGSRVCFVRRRRRRSPD